MKLEESNKRQREEAADRWWLILELSKTMTQSEIGKKLDLSRQRVSQVVKKAREYFGDDNKEGESPKVPQ